MHRLIKYFLVITFLLSSGIAIHKGFELRGMQAEVRRLRNLAGELTIADPSKISIVAMKTHDPLCFAWRMYVPPGKPYRWITTHLGNRSERPEAPIGAAHIREIRVRLFPPSANNESWMVATSYAFHTWPVPYLDPASPAAGISVTGSSSRHWHRFESESYLKQLTNPKSQLRIRQVGTSGTIELPSSGPMVLLRVEFSEDFQREQRPLTVSRFEEERLSKPFLEYEIADFDTNTVTKNIR